MWIKRKYHGSSDKLNMFLEAIESDEEVTEGQDIIAEKIVSGVRKGLSSDEIWDSVSNESPGVLFGIAQRLIKSGKIKPEDVGIQAEENETSISDKATENQEKIKELKTSSEIDNDSSDGGNEDESEDSEGESFNIGESEEDKKQMKESQFSRKDYNVVVDIIVNASDKIADELDVEGKTAKIKSILAKEFADVFKADNPRFDADRFLNALGE